MSNDPRGDSPRERFERTSFLNGANAAFVEQLYARYQQDRNSVDAEWQQFFDSLGDTREEVLNEAKGASWQRADWPVVANGELVSALDGNWPISDGPIQKKISERKGGGASEAEIRAATLDSVRALMMIRAYRLRCHLDANIDPLSLRPESTHPELHPQSHARTRHWYAKRG